MIIVDQWKAIGFVNDTACTLTQMNDGTWEKCYALFRTKQSQDTLRDWLGKVRAYAKTHPGDALADTAEYILSKRIK